MQYDEKSVSESQQKLAQKCIDCVIDGFQLNNPPEYIIKGLNPDEEIAKLEFQKLKVNGKELKKIEREIKFTQNYIDNFIKVTFELEENPKKLIYMSDFLNTSKFPVLRHIWVGVLDFPIPSPTIFGRVCRIKRHKGGKYYFASLGNLKYELVDRLERLEEKLPDLFPYKIIESNLLIDLIGSLKYVSEVKQNLRHMREIVKMYKQDVSFAYDLNQKKELIKSMKTIPHFGTVQYGLMKLVSDTDVSTILIPYKEVTYFHIDQIGYPKKKQCRSIFSLINALEEYNS
ncbi:MAG: hypothetical protein ACXAC5_12870 [Promethearchaeota archaeon]|jgi:hypothetical protein